MTLEAKNSKSLPASFWVMLILALMIMVFFILLKDAEKGMGELKTANVHCYRVIWSILLFADKHGRFPESEEELIETEIRESLTGYLDPGDTNGQVGYMTSLGYGRVQYTYADGQTHEDWHLEFQKSLRLVDIEWNSDSSKAPTVTLRKGDRTFSCPRGNQWLIEAEAVLRKKVPQELSTESGDN